LVRPRLTKRAGASHWQGNPHDGNWLHPLGQVRGWWPVARFRGHQRRFV